MQTESNLTGQGANQSLNPPSQGPEPFGHENEFELRKYIEHKKAKVQAMAMELETKLDDFLPQANEAITAIKSVRKYDVLQLTMRPPSRELQFVMSAVMILLKEPSPTNWLSTKKAMNSDSFLPRIVNFDRKGV